MISICIPCYEMHGKGNEYLTLLLDTLYQQTFKEFEIVISDQSKDDKIFEIYKNNKEKFDISYSKCDRLGKSSYNLNNAIKKAKYDIIKPIFQDDFLIDKRCLEFIANIPKDVKWGGIGFTHYNEKNEHIGNTMIPRYNPEIKTGINTFGSPSVSFFCKESNYFHDELVWLMDCEFYEKLKRKYGNPYIINMLGVGIRVWNDSYSNHISDEIKLKENKIVGELYV